MRAVVLLLPSLTAHAATIEVSPGNTLEIGGGPAVVRNNIVSGDPHYALYVYDYGGRGCHRARCLHPRHGKVPREHATAPGGGIGRTGRVSC